MLNVLPATPTAVTNAVGTFLNPTTPPWYIGNAGFALQCSNGNSGSCPANITGTWENIGFNQANNPGGNLFMSHSAAIFTQLAPYGSSFINVTTTWLYGGYIEAAPYSGRILTADTSRFYGMDLSDLIPLVTYNGNDRTFTNINLYSEFPGDLGMFMLSNGCAPVGSNGQQTFQSLYMEGNPTTNGEYSRFCNYGIQMSGANIGGVSSNGVIEMDGTGTNWDGIMTGTVNIRGNHNRFRNTQNNAWNDFGWANTTLVGIQGGTPNYMSREYNSSARPYVDALGKLDGASMTSGNSDALYLNAADLMTHCEDWAYPSNPANSANATCVVDNTSSEIPYTYMQSGGATTTIEFLSNGSPSNIWSGGQNSLAARKFGVNVPQAKVNVYMYSRCIPNGCTGSGTFLLKDGTANSTLGTTTFSLSNTWTKATLSNVDLSATTVGDIVDFRWQSVTNSGTNYQVAIVGIQPINVDEHTWLANNGLPVSGGTLLPASSSGVLCTGPSSGVTSGHLMVASGTNCNLVDGGAAPAALLTSVPPWLQWYGDGSNGALNVTSGTTTLTSGEYNYTTCNISAGAIVVATTTPYQAPLIIRCNGTATIAGTVSWSPNTGGANGNATAANYGGAGGGGGGGTAAGTAGSNVNGVNGGTAGVASGGTGSAGTAAGGQLQKIFLSFGANYQSGQDCGGANGGGGGSTGAGTGGRGGGCIVIVAPSLNFSGTCDVSGVAGGASTANNAGAGGGGGGGICLLRSPSMTNTGTFTVTGGAGGSCGSFTGCGTGGAGANGWSKVYTQ